MKQILLLGLCVIMVACGGTTKEKKYENTSSKTEIYQIDNQVLSSDTYEAKILYTPFRFADDGLVERLEAMVDAEKQLFLGSDGLKQVEKDPSLRKWKLDIEVKPVYQSEQFSSFLISVYIDSGGNHGNGHYQVLNYDHRFSDSIEFTEIFDDKQVLDMISERTIISLKKELNDHKWLEKGAEPDMLNFQFWIYTPVGMLIHFPPYQVGPYVVGSKSVMIEKDYLVPYLSRLGKRMWGGK